MAFRSKCELHIAFKAERDDDERKTDHFNYNFIQIERWAKRLVTTCITCITTDCNLHLPFKAEHDDDPQRTRNFNDNFRRIERWSRQLMFDCMPTSGFNTNCLLHLNYTDERDERGNVTQRFNENFKAIERWARYLVGNCIECATTVPECFDAEISNIFRRVVNPTVFTGPSFGLNTWTANYSSTPVAGRLLIACLGADNPGPVTLLSPGWTSASNQLVQQTLPMNDGGVFVCAAKIADGTETTFQFRGTFQGHIFIVEARANVLSGGSGHRISNRVDAVHNQISAPSITPDIPFTSTANCRMDFVHAFHAPSAAPAPAPGSPTMHQLGLLGNQSQVGPIVLYASCMGNPPVSPSAGRAWNPYTGSCSFVIQVPSS